VGQQFTLSLNGSNFNASTVQILVRGTNCAPCTIPNNVLTTKTSTQIAGPVTLNNSGSFNITAQNGSGGGESNVLTLTVGTATPSLTAYSTTPSSPVAGQQFTLNLSGNNFDPSTAEFLFTGPGCSPCTVPNSVLTTKSATLLIGPVTLNTAGSYTLTVQNGSGGAPSNGLSLTVNEFSVGEYVKVSGTGGAGLNLRSCANTTCSVVVNMPDGTVMQVIGGPTVAAGYTWWNLTGTVAGASRTGWAVQDYLTTD
jgi:hypothetical protein